MLVEATETTMICKLCEEEIPASIFCLEDGICNQCWYNEEDFDDDLYDIGWNQRDEF